MKSHFPILFIILLLAWIFYEVLLDKIKMLLSIDMILIQGENCDWIYLVVVVINELLQRYGDCTIHDECWSICLWLHSF